MLTHNEIQVLIDNANNNEIDKLFKEEEYNNSVLYIMENYNILSFNKEFVQNFFYDRLEEIAQYSSKTKHFVDFIYFTDTINSVVNKLNYTEVDWDNHINAAIKYNSLQNFNGEMTPYHFINVNKNTEYLRYLINNLSKITSNIKLRPDISYLPYSVIGGDVVNALPKDEKLKIIETLNTLGNRIRYRFKDVNQPELFNNKSDIIKYSNKNDINCYNIYKYSDIEEVIDMLNYLMDVPEGNTFREKSILNAIENKRHIIDDELTEKIIDKWGRLDKLIPIISKENVLEYFPNSGPKQLIKNPTISIDDLPNLTTRKDSLFRSRFFREEEIIKHPEYFDPSELKNYEYTYISKETFKLLNKTWNKRQRYNKDLTNFRRILMENIYELTTQMSIDDIKYLAQKTKASNKDIISAFLQTYGNNFYIKNVITLLELYKKGKL